MRARQLRTTLLIKAIEESDPAGEVLPLADRGEATLRALRGIAPSEIGRGSANALSRQAETILARRANDLSQRLSERFPVVRLLSRSPGMFGPARALLVLALAAGAFLSVLDGSRRIDILAFPLLALIAWNLLVYLLLFVSMLRGRRDGEVGSLLAGLYRRWVRWRTGSKLRAAASFNAPLARALQVFAADWTDVARSQLLRRARSLLHAAAAAIAAGLIAGLYVQGVVLRYEAGWESTFLTPGQVHTLLRVVYGPAAALSGIALPADAAAVDALRWTASNGAEAASWIHLIGLTAIIYVVAPRALLALLSGIDSWLVGRRLGTPASVISYGRNVLGRIGAPAGEGIVRVTPYAYTPGKEPALGLHRVLTAALGGGIRLDLADEVRWGEEDFFLRRLSERITGGADFEILVMNLAATPERENHGVILEAVRDARLRLAGATPLLVIVDETTYTMRLQGDATLAVRLAERRAVWSEFVARYGTAVCCIDLGREAHADAPEPDDAACVRAALLAHV
ncbi:MAG: DUF2868 domain-containing protein [Gammaproteobacteria bacterium]